MGGRSTKTNGNSSAQTLGRVLEAALGDGVFQFRLEGKILEAGVVDADVRPLGLLRCRKVVFGELLVVGEQNLHEPPASASPWRERRGQANNSTEGGHERLRQPWLMPYAEKKWLPEGKKTAKHEVRQNETIIKTDMIIALLLSKK